MTNVNGEMTKQRNTGEHQVRPSATDPDVLRSLLQQSRGQSISIRRITSTEIKALKVTQRKEDRTTVAFNRALRSLIHGIGTLFTGSSKKVTQCDLYGHVRQSSSWEGQYPTCVHCNIQITSPDMLRTATAKI